jgi:excisionase family DNA binding protein
MISKPLNVEEVAELLGVSTDVIYSMVKQGKIPYFKVGNRLIRFQASSIQEWMNEQEQCNYQAS